MSISGAPVMYRQWKDNEHEALKPQRRRADGVLLLPEVHLQASPDRYCLKCICSRRQQSFYSNASAP